MSVLRDLRWVATEAAHLALDVVEHVARCYAPLPKSPVGNAHNADLRADDLAEREAAEEVSEGSDAEMWRSSLNMFKMSSPAAASAGTAGVCGEAESEPPPASPQINLTQWLQPAIQEALAEHEAYDYAGHVECPHYRGGSEVCDDWMAWREHVSEDIAEHVVVALSAWLGRPL